jgi:hypothetical protein
MSDPKKERRNGYIDIAGKIDSLDDKFSNLDDKVEKIVEAIHGNGEPGIKTRLFLQEEKSEQFEEYIKMRQEALRDERIARDKERTEDRKMKWALFIVLVGTSLTILGNIFLG